MDKVTGVLEVGNVNGEVVVNHPDFKPDENGAGHIVFSPGQARNLARLLLKQAAECDGFPGTGEEGEYFIEFDTKTRPGALEAVRVRIDLVKITNMKIVMDIGLKEHPLYRELVRYVMANRR